MRLVLRVAALLIPVAGCMFAQRDPEPAVCPQLAAGALAISEIRKASASDTLASWVELYNTSSDTIDLRGVELRFRNPTGASEQDVTVGRSVAVAAGAYVTLGLADDGALPDYLDYGFLGQLTGTWPSDAALEVDSCGAKVDLVQYGSLPSTGTLSLNGAKPPSADDNDFTTNFCTDPNPAGTPRATNIVCPSTP